MPITSTQVLVVCAGRATAIHHGRVDNKSDENKHFTACSDKFKFRIATGTKQIDKNDQHPENSNKGTVGHWSFFVRI